MLLKLDLQKQTVVVITSIKGLTLYYSVLLMFNCVNVNFWFITRHLSNVLKSEAEFPIIIKCYLKSFDSRSSDYFRSHTDFTGTICFCTALLNVLEITQGMNIGILTVRAPIVINVPTRGLLAVEIKDSFTLWLEKFKYQKNCFLNSEYLSFKSVVKITACCY